MAYRFTSDSTVESNVHQILDEQLSEALRQLTDNFSENPAEVVHDTRKRLKKGRSLLRLVRKSMDKATYKHEKNILRDIGRLLAPARDGAAFQETLDVLLKRYELTLDVDAFTDLQESLATLYQVRLQSLTERDQPVKSIIADLKDSKSRLLHLSLEKTGWGAIGQNLHRVYRQGCERMQAAYEEDSDRAFHEWRKRVKDLWYDTRLLKKLWPPVMDTFASEAHQLSSILGEAQDIAELRHFLLNHPEEVKLKAVLKKVLMPLMDHSQYKLHQQAAGLGHRLYAEDSQSFTHRIECYWQQWCSATKANN